MSREVFAWNAEHFLFDSKEAAQSNSGTVVAVHDGPLGPAAVIPDAHLLFNADFARVGADLILHGEHGKTVVVHDYFASDHRAQLLSPDGAVLRSEVVAALVGPLAPGQYAQAAATQSGAEAVGRVVKVSGDATILRNGVAITLHVGDAILKGDVMQTGGGTLGVTFNDGSTLNLTPHARLVVNEFIYDAQGSHNSEVLNLVQGSLTFISGHIAHQGDMKINTPVATLGIRGTVGGVAEATDGTVSFFVAESATGAVLTDNQGHVLAQVVQSGPLILVRPGGPLNVLAEEVQKSPAELAKELAIVQQMISLQSVGNQIINQFLQQNPNNPNPHSIGSSTHTQIEIQFPTQTADNTADHVTGTVHTTTTDTTTGIPTEQTQFFTVPIPTDVTPPNAPTISAVDDVSPITGTIANGASTNDATPTIHVALAGTGALAGDTVELFNGTSAVGGPVILTAANISAGYIDITTPALGNGVTYHLNASITDAAGNTSQASNEVVFIVDTQAPTLAAVTGPTYTDTPAADHFGAASGTLLGNDGGAGTTLTYGIVGGGVDTSHSGYDVSLTGAYGAFFVNSASGAYTFVPNDAAINALSAPTTESFTVTVSGLAGQSAQQSLIVTLNGANDAPAIAGASSTGGVRNDTLSAVAASYLVAGNDLVNGLGGTSGFGENSLVHNDDGSSGPINITSVFGSDGLNFFGHTYTSLFVNNNGNITFGYANPAYSPLQIDAGFNNPIIAPFWADVDTRGSSGASNLVYYDLDSTNHVFTVTWDQVGYYNSHTDLLDSFQLQLIGTGQGNFDIIFRYESINWTTGDASRGTNGLGGDVARAGYSAGDNISGHYSELSGSGVQSAMLALNSTLGNTGIAGVHLFEVNSGNVAAAPVANGNIQFTDPDSADSHTASFVAANGGLHADNTPYIGTFVLDDPANNVSHVTEPVGGTPGSVAWHFSMTSQEIDNIPINTAVTQSYDVAVTDNHGSAAHQTESVSVGGLGSDTFVFNANNHLGADTIVNFHTNTDHIELDGFAFQNDAELIAAITANQHNDAVINLGHGDSVTVAGVTQDYLQHHLDLFHFNVA